MAISKPRKPKAISFIHLGKIEHAMQCGKTVKQALAYAGLSQTDIDSAADDDMMACFAVALLNGDSAEDVTP